MYPEAVVRDDVLWDRHHLPRVPAGGAPRAPLRRNGNAELSPNFLPLGNSRGWTGGALPYHIHNPAGLKTFNLIVCPLEKLG
ncbi:Hypothetical protein AA314_01883 [Archangium gephyra]|uniref:Uncharacterized protein n=1 Tax=Archangium gephyra TaxID=48 RepID=A0AAC8TBS7_9BACT|nr:Hypothetical protein AA314_01883 [Archangium gephyra]